MGIVLAAGTQQNYNGFSYRASRVYVVEDHPRMRHFITNYLNLTGALTVTGQAASAEAALEDPEIRTSDLVITDLSLPGISGIMLTRRLCAEDPERPIIVLSAMLERYYVKAALDAGARAFVAKDCFDKLEDVIIQVLSGERDIKLLPGKGGGCG